MIELLVLPLLAFAAGWWLERKLITAKSGARLLLPLGLLGLTVMWYLLSEHQRGLSGFQYLFCAVITAAGLLGAGIGWLTKQVEGPDDPS